MEAKLLVIALALLAFAFVLGGCTGPAAPGASNPSSASAASSPSNSNASAPAASTAASGNTSLNQEFRAPEQCMFDQAGFLCEKPLLQASGTAPNGHTGVPGLLHLTLVNGDRKTIVIKAISCIRGRMFPSGDAANTDSWPAYTQIKCTVGYQEQIDDLGNFTDDNGNAAYVSCVDATKNSDGYAQLPGSAAIALSPGEDFSGRIYVAYNYADDEAGWPPRIVGANLVVRAR